MRLPRGPGPAKSARHPAPGPFGIDSLPAESIFLLFFRSLRLPRAILDTSCGGFCAKSGAMNETKDLGSDLGTTNEPPEGLGTFKNHSFPAGKHHLCKKHVFNSKLEKERPHASREDPREPLWEPRGRRREAETDQLVAPRGPQDAPHEFFSSPEAPKSDLGHVLGPIWRETGPQERNKGSWQRFGSDK